MANDLRTPWPPEYRRNLKRKNSYSFAALLWGTRGDVQPFIALGAELVRRGHRALVAAREPYRGLAEEQGVGFFPMPEDGTEEFMKAMAGVKGIPGMLSLSAAYSRGLLAEQFRLFAEAAREADVILTKAMSTAPAIHVAERRGIPPVLVHIDPGFIPSEKFCMAGDRFADKGKRMNRLMPAVMLAAFALTVADRINAWRIRQGLPPDRLGRRNRARHLFRFPALMAWSPFFLPPSPDWPQWYVQTGWWRLPRRRMPDSRLREFVLSGPPPLYIGFGSWDVHAKAPVTEAILGALRITGERAVLLGGTVDRRAAFPPEVLVADSVPLDWLLPRVKAAVHHGGAGTTGAASMAGVPSVVIPAFDAQTPWGHLVAEKRVGTLVRQSEVTAERLAEAIREVGRPEVRDRARVLGVLLRGEGGVRQAADEIERRLWEATQKPRKAVLRLAEVHPAFPSGESIESLPSPDPRERPLAGGEPAAGDPVEGITANPAAGRRRAGFEIREETLTTDSRAAWPSEYLRNFRRKKSYRFAVLNWGTRGDIQPFLALGAELTGRGHRMVLAAREPYRALAEERGIEFFAMEEDGTEDLMRSLAACRNVPDMLRVSTAYSRAITRAQMRGFWEASRGADAILTKAITTAPALHIAEGRGVPVFLAHFDPGFLPNRSYCFWGGRLQDLGCVRNRFTASFLLLSFALSLSDIINAWRRERGMRMDPLAARNWSFHLSRLPAFAAWSGHFLPRPPDWPEWVVQTGWWILPRAGDIDPRLREFVRAGPPPLYIGFGSWGIHEKTVITDAILEALRRTGDRAVLLRNTLDGRKEFPPNVLVADELPHDWLLPRVKAAVHHGGAGTAGAAITAGVPSVVVPSFDMQAAWGRKIAERGIGTVLALADLTAGRLAAALGEVGRAEVRDRAHAIGKRARKDGGARQAADEIERRLSEIRGTARIRLVRGAEGAYAGRPRKPFLGPMPSPDVSLAPRILEGEPLPEEDAEEE